MPALPQLPTQPIPTLVWQAGYASLEWLDGVVQPSASGQALALAQDAQLVLATFVSGLAVLNVETILAGLAQDLPLLQATAALPISYTSGQAALLDARIAANQMLAAALPGILPTTWPVPASALAIGQLGIQPSGDLLSLLMTFQGETPPSAYSGTFQSLQANASGYVSTWSQIVSAVSGYYSGNPPGAPLDACTRALSGAALIASIVTGLTYYSASGASLPTVTSWNQAFATPALLASCSLSQPDLSTLAGQQNMVSRAWLIAQAQQVAIFTLIAEGLASTGVANQTTYANQGQGLMDIAASNLGRFGSWVNLRTGIPAPWTAGSLGPGQKVQLVSGALGLGTNPLGTDIYLGEQNTPMGQWTGDFLTILGLGNYQYALGRRLATTLGNLIYEPIYGSRIPPEAGATQSAAGAALIAAFGQQALAADPRTQTVLGATATQASGNPTAVEFQGQVLPVGLGQQPQAVSLTIGGSGQA